MRTEELSIGDWVCAKLAKWESDDADMTPPLQVKRINGIERHNLYVDLFNPANNSIEHSAFVEDLIPIPLTPEILEKNGKTNKDYLAWLIAGRAVVEKEPTGEYSVHIYDAAIDKVLVTACAQHVHQLQHALRLAGIEKEIEV